MKGRVRLKDLSDEVLVGQLEELCRLERRVGAAIVAHLCEVERRRIHLDAGYSSLYTYCVGKLGLAEDVAYKRMQAARAVGRHPRALEHLAAGRLTLSSLVVLAPHLDAHGAELADAACGKSKREVQRLVAEWRGMDSQLDPDPVRAVLEPVAGGVRLEVVLDDATTRALDEALDLDGHLDPHGDVGALLGRALTMYAQARRRARHAERAPRGTAASVSAPRALARNPAPSQARKARARRYVPADVRRQVAQRDGRRCAYVSPDGHRCSETRRLELDHAVPLALGGEHDPETMRLLCQRHNQRAAERSYGQRYMEERRREAASALTNLGFTRRQAQQGIDVAMASLVANPSMEELLRASLRALRRAEEGA